MRGHVLTRRRSRRLPLDVRTLLLLTVLPLLRNSSAQPSCPAFEGYDTVAGRDADLGDLGRVAGNASMARAACEAVPNCAGFNSRGWLKATLANWKVDSSICTYTRQGGSASTQCPDFRGFVARPGEDADLNDIWQPAAWDPSAAFTACNNNPWCKGFNNKGYVKHTLANWKADPVVCTYERNNVWSMDDAFAGQIGVGFNPRNCLNIDPKSMSMEPYMRECHDSKDLWGHHGQYFHFERVMSITEARVFTIRIDPPLVQTTFYNKGGCLTRGEIIFDATIYLSPCQPLYLTDNYGREYFNQNTRYQQWRIEPFTVSGMSGVRIVGGTVAASGYCLQLEKDSQESPLLFRQDWVDKFLFQRCAADSKRQLFAVAVLD